MEIATKADVLALSRRLDDISGKISSLLEVKKYNKKQAAEKLGVSFNTLQKMIKEGVIATSSDYGKREVITQEAIDDFKKMTNS